MSLVVLLDAGPLGLVTNPRGSREADQCNRWLESLLLRGIEVCIPEIADYEVCRELLRADKVEGLVQIGGSSFPFSAFVIPAKAGIYSPACVWIPACAGMTAWGSSLFSIRSGTSAAVY